MAIQHPPISHFVAGAAKAPKGERSAWQRGLRRAVHLSLAHEIQAQGKPLSAATIKAIKNMK